MRLLALTALLCSCGIKGPPLPPLGSSPSTLVQSPDGGPCCQEQNK